MIYSVKRSFGKLISLKQASKQIFLLIIMNEQRMSRFYLIATLVSTISMITPFQILQCGMYNYFLTNLHMKGISERIPLN